MALNNNFYKNAIKPETHQANPGMHFHFGQVGYKEFAEKYQSYGWVKRKFAALPLALWSVTVKTIYHLCKAILIGIPKAIFDKGMYFKAQFFHIGRNFEESFGRIMSIFHDKYGLYHIHKSQYHHFYYDTKLSLKNGEMKQGIMPRFVDLRDIVNFLDPEDASIPFPNYDYNFINYDLLTDHQFHCLFSLDDPKLSDKFEVLYTDNFKKIMKYFDKPEYFSKISSKHINSIDYDTLTAKQFRIFFSLEDRNLKMKFGAMYSENFKKIMKYFDELKYFSFIPNHQLYSINFDTLTESQFGYLFSYNDPDLMNRFNYIDASDFKKIVKFIKHPKYFSAIPSEYVKYLNFETLTKSQIDNLFEGENGYKRYQTLNSNQVLKMFDKLDLEQLYYITDEMLLSNDALFNKFKAKVNSHKYEHSSILTQLRLILATVELNRLKRQRQQRQQQRNNDYGQGQSFFGGSFWEQFFGQSGFNTNQQQKEQERKADLKMLGLKEGATDQQIRQTFRALSKTAHPDRVQRNGKLEGETEEAFLARVAYADNKFREISASWDRLKASFS